MYDRVPDILEGVNFSDYTFPTSTAFPDIDLKEEDFNSLKELDLEHSFFSVDHIKCDTTTTSTFIDNLAATDSSSTSSPVPDDFMACNDEGHRGEKRSICETEDEYMEDLADIVDTSDKLRRDCMWSSSPSYSGTKIWRPDVQQTSASTPAAPCYQQFNLAQSSLSAPFLPIDELGLTPPTSYIHQYIEQFQEVLSETSSCCSDDVCSVVSCSSSSSTGEESDWPSSASDCNSKSISSEHASTPSTETKSLSTATTAQELSCQVLESSRNLSSGDHSYYTSASRVDDTNLLTPPESSDDDEDSLESSILQSPPPCQPTTPTLGASSRFPHKLLSPVTKSRVTPINSRNRLDTESLRQQIERIAEQRRASRPLPKFTIKVQMKAKTKLQQQQGTNKSLKHFKKMPKQFSHLLKSSPPTKQSMSLLHQSVVSLEKPRDSRDLHNHMERQRRNELRNAFEFLKRHVPCVAQSDRASKQLILDKAIEFCQEVRAKEDAVARQRQAMHDKKIALQKRLVQLQKQQNSSLH